jgi:hypothetical protein
MDNVNIQGPITTADSAREGRLMVSAGGIKNKKRKILKKIIKSK